MVEDENGDYVEYDDIRDIIIKAKQLDTLLDRAKHALEKRGAIDIPEEGCPLL